MLGARCTKYQLEPAPLPSVSTSCVSGKPCGMREGHGFGDRLDDAGAHDLIGRLRGLAAADRSKMRNRLAECGEDRPRALEGLRVSSYHDDESCVACAFDAAADGAVKELGAAHHFGRALRSLGTHRRAVEDETAGLQSRGELPDDIEYVGIRCDTYDDRIHFSSKARKRGGSVTAKLGGERLRFFRCAIPDSG
jgi:hypothetical protein